MLKSNCFLYLVIISLICLTTPLIAQVELESHWGGGKCQAVAVSETHVFAGFGSFLFSINIETYKIMGKKMMPNAIIDIVVEGNIA